MNRLPCKKCPQCGLFNDFTIDECECGKKLNNISVQLIDTDLIPPENCGEIDISLKVYVQKCSACGALNYTDDPTAPVTVCYNCHKTRIASIIPAEFVDEESAEKEETNSAGGGESRNMISFSSQQAEAQDARHQQPPIVADDDDADDDDDGGNSARWKGILRNIQKTIGSEYLPERVTPSRQGAQQPVKQTATEPLGSVDDDDDDDEPGDWSGILGLTPKQGTSPAPKQQPRLSPVKKDITLTAIRYGRLSFTVEAGHNTYMLGRSAEQASFLSQDGQVGNEHCYLFYRDGAWFVKDNHSQNGTAVNSRDIGINGEFMLSDGDELKLGHRPDSIAFRITVN